MTDTRIRPPAEQPARTPERTPAPSLGPAAGLRFVWTQLTSMRTALVLLFLLAVAAIPGSLVPQRAISPIGVSDFIRQHSTLGPLYERIGLFHVYTSPWFSAIYLLLFVSLVGCIIPRVGVYARALRRPPPKVPHNLHRLPASTHVDITHDDPTTVIKRAAEQLRRQRYRVQVAPDGLSVAAERGYLREAGNLVFHVSLLLLLGGVAVGAFYGFRGTGVVVVGHGFSNNITQYDDISAGPGFTDAALVPFTIRVNNFDARFETGPVQRGAARLFKASLQVINGPGQPPYDTTLEVNKPLSINGTTVHLIGHGYAPRITVRDGNGDVAFSGPIVFLPQDGRFTSAGVVKVPDARPDRLVFQAIFAPTSVPGQGPRSAFPDALLPALYFNAFAGPPKTETGIPENIYTFNQAGLTQLRNPDGTVVAVRLTPGESFRLPDGKGSIQFDGWSRWVKLQIGTAPGAPITLTAIGLAVAGLCLSLFIRPRRLWVRLTTDDHGSRRLEVAGLDRADARAGLIDDVEALAARLTDQR